MLAINSLVDGGRFQILDVLGKGGSGVAYLAFDTHSSPKHPKYYAIKCVPRPANDSDASALLREIRLHKLVAQHPGVVTLKRCVHEGQYQLFVLDFFPGGDLFRQITQQHRYFQNDALITDVFLQIIDAVEFCHQQGVFHRDLKPENVLCNADGTHVVLADFGLATRQPVSDDLGVGSGYYMSPECNAGPAYSTVANDMWSLGVILCNLAFGRNPWAQAVSSDATFAAYAANPAYLSAILPASPATARILTGPRGLFSLDPRRRMTLAELRMEVERTTRWTMNDDELRYASAEARSVAGVIRSAVRERDAKLAAAAVQHTPAPVAAPRPRPQPVVAAPAPSPSPAPSPIRPSLAAAHGRNSSLRLVLQKVAAPFTSSSNSSSSSSSASRSSMPPTPSSTHHYHSHARPTEHHIRRPSLAPTEISALSDSSSSSNSNDSLNSPMPLTPPASAYGSQVDVFTGGSQYGVQWPANANGQSFGKREWNNTATVNVIPVRR